MGVKISSEYSPTRLYGTVRGRPIYPEKPYKRDSPKPLPIHTQESGPGDWTLYADNPCI